MNEAALHELWSISTAQLRSVTHTEILEREPALSIAKRSAAAQADQLLVMRRRRFNADDFVLCYAVGAVEHVDCGIWHA